MFAYVRNMFAKHDEQKKLICILTFHKRYTMKMAIPLYVASINFLPYYVAPILDIPFANVLYSYETILVSIIVIFLGLGDLYVYTDELQWLEYLCNHAKMFETGVDRPNDC